MLVGTPRARQARGLRLHVAAGRDAACATGLGGGAGDGAHGGHLGDGNTGGALRKFMFFLMLISWDFY